MKYTILTYRQISNLTGARWMDVNLQPDERGPMHRNQTVLTDRALGYDRVPPTQRLGDPSKHTNAAHANPDSVGRSDATDHKKRYEVVLDKQAAAAMRRPCAYGNSEAYRYLHDPPSMMFQT